MARKVRKHTCRTDLFCPLKCYVCEKEIQKGEEYYNSGAQIWCIECGDKLVKRDQMVVVCK